MALPPELQGALLDRRVVFMRGKLDDAMASNVIGQLLLVSRMAPGKPVELYMDSPGGSVAAALAVYDIVQTLGSPVATMCLGSLSGPAVAVLAGGSAGRRFALPHARIQLSDTGFDLPSVGQADLTAQAAEAQRQRTRWQECLARHTAHSVAHIGKDLTTGRWLSAAEARDYGLVDGIIPGMPQT